MTTPDTTSRLEELSSALADPRMGHAFTPEQSCSLTLWIIEQTAGDRNATLLYGWVLRSHRPPMNKWSDAERKLEAGVRRARLNLTAPWTTIQRVLERLLDGETLEEACDSVSLVPPRDYGRKLRLARAEANPASVYRVTPVLLVETSHATLGRAPYMTPLSSPSDEAPGMSVSLYLTQKVLMWAQSETNDAPLFSASVLRAALEDLCTETGRDFRGADAARMGNIEWLAFPAMSEAEAPAASVRVVSREQGDTKRAEAIAVTVRAGALGADDEAIVRCRQQAGREVSRDECQVVSGSGGSELIFAVVEPLGRTTVEIWKRPKGSPLPFALWYAQVYSWLSRVELSMGIVGLKGRIESNLLTAVKSPKLADRVTKLMTFSHVHRERSVLIGDREHLWEASSSEARTLASRLFPQASGAKFFGKGWGEGDRLSFYEWLREVAKHAKGARLVFVDPFFDSVGVELFARMEETQVAYAAVTSTLVPSEDDAEDQPTRSARLVNACKQLEPVLRRLDFRIYDVLTQSKKRRPLHDRYILIFDADDTIASGFHLSNSIQLATKTYPLLVTPIPFDVLPDVAKYLKGILECDPELVGEAELRILYERESTSSKQPAVRGAFGGEMLAIVLADDALRQANAEQLEERRASLEEGIPTAHLPSLAERLLDADDVNFFSLWSSWGDLCARSTEGENVMRALAEQAGDRLLPRLADFLLQGPKEPAPAGLANVPLVRDIESLVHHFDRSFLESLDQAGYFISHGSIRIYGIEAWGLRAAAKLLAACPNAGLLVEVASRTQGESLGLTAALRAPYLNLFALITDCICTALERKNSAALIEELLHSQCGFLRALGARAPSEVSASFEATVLRALDDDVEAVHALAEWASDLRVVANRADNVEIESVRNQRLSVFAEILKRWPDDWRDSSRLVLREVFHRVSGPLEGSWARTTVADLLLPLVDQGTLSLEEVVELLVSIVIERIEANAKAAPRTERYQYCASTDGELIDVAAALLARAKPDLQDVKVKVVKKALTTSSRTLERPFVRTADYNAWESARDALAWIGSFLGLLWLHADQNDGFDGAGVHELCARAWDALEPQQPTESYSDVTGLYGFSDSVKEAVAKRRAAGGTVADRGAR